MSTAVSVRKVWAKDLPYLKLLFAEDGMALPSKKELESGLAAVSERGELVGFIRILQVADEENPLGDGNYVYPVIVFKSWQGHGVGRALIEEAHRLYGELRLVSCLASRGFYPKCGFEPLAWEEVAHRVANDCKHCPDLSSCEPQAFIKGQG